MCSLLRKTQPDSPHSVNGHVLIHYHVTSALHAIFTVPTRVFILIYVRDCRQDTLLDLHVCSLSIRRAQSGIDARLDLSTCHVSGEIALSYQEAKHPNLYLT
ncbi:hypothetical protein OBBRIDRAFT_435430 [Obba rivulosa]|uniref:Uncharacterized protein n=1 Tax=Obba rivulosa TaxID=1052685 RepID=A0A8E2DP11_9APHY|nr:hypothetical protein OBBRIDRAFT_435430 [Obba rivulosa]